MTKGKQFAQEAADRLNATANRLGSSPGYAADDYGVYPPVTAEADTLAELAEAKDDLREIDRGKGGSGPHMPLDPATLKQLADWLDDAGQNIGAARANGLTEFLAGWEARLCAYVATKLRTTATIAAKYRETDPLVEIFTPMFWDRQTAINAAQNVRAELDKRGLEVGVKS